MVTCATSGVGLACAMALAAEGVHVIGVSRRAATTGVAIRKLLPEEFRIDWIDCDIGDECSLATLMELIPPVDIVVFVPVREKQSSLMTAGFGDYQDAFSRGVRPYLGMVHASLRTMTENGYGRFISLLGASTLAPLWDHTLSNVARLSVAALGSGGAREFASSGITFNNIILGVFDTPGLKAVWEARCRETGTDLRQYAIARTEGLPGKTLGEPSQCGALVALLASPMMNYLTGQSIRVDGGLHPAL